MIDQEKERERFEAWWLNGGGGEAGLVRDPTGKAYADNEAEATWDGWRSRAALDGAHGVGAPVAWQWRYRAIGQADEKWGDWMDGPAPDGLRTNTYEFEERPLYAAPPPPPPHGQGGLGRWRLCLSSRLFAPLYFAVDCFPDQVEARFTIGDERVHPLRDPIGQRQRDPHGKFLLPAHAGGICICTKIGQCPPFSYVRY